MNTKTKLLVGLAVFMALVLGAGGAVLLSGSSDDDKSVASGERSTSTSTDVTTPSTAVTTTSTAAPISAQDTPQPAKSSATTTTTKKPSTPGITLADEPSFTSVTAPSEEDCGLNHAGSFGFFVNWSAINATSVTIETNDGQSYPNRATSGSLQLQAFCARSSVTVAFRATGPGGTVSEFRYVAISHIGD